MIRRVNEARSDNIKETGNGYRFGDILTISFAHLLHDTYSSFLAPLLPLLIAKLGFGYTLAGMLSMFSRIPSLVNPFIGVFADRVSMRFFVILAPAVTCISMSLLGIAPNYIVLALLLLVMGFSAAMFHVPAPVMVRKVSGNRVGKGMSFYMLGGEFARTIGPLIILGAVSLWGLEGTWRLIPIGLGASVFFYFKLRNIQVSDTLQAQQKKTRGVRKEFRRFLPFLLLIAGILLSRSFMKAGMTLFLPTYLKSRGNTLWFSGSALSVLEFAGALGTLYFGSVSDRIGRKNAMLILSSLSPFLLLALIWLDGIFTIPILLLAGFCLLGTTPVLLAAVQEIAADYPAFFNGMFMTISFSIGALASVAVGALSDKLGLQQTLFISAIIAFAAIPLSLAFPAKHGNSDTGGK